MPWQIERTETFLQVLREHKKNAELLHALESKLIRLQMDPEAVGARLSGELHGLHSTRLVKKFRLIFRIDPVAKKVYLLALDHRKEAYE